MTLIGGYPAANSHQNTNFKTFYDAVIPPTGPQLRIERIYIGTTNNTGPQTPADVKPAIAAGRTPIISFKLGTSWANVATGAEDARFDALFNTTASGLLSANISGLAMPPRLCFHHEPEGGGTVQQYNAMWQHLVERYKAVVRGAGWDFAHILTGGIFRDQNNDWSLASLDTAVAGIDVHRMYADPYMKPGGGPWSVGPWVNPNQTSTVFRAHRDWCNARGYTAAWPEYACLQQEGDADGSFQAEFIDATRALTWLNELEFIIYYDRVPGEGGATSYSSCTHGGTLSGPSSLALTAFSKLAQTTTPPPPAPTIGSFTPTSGLVGTAVTITGNNLTGATTVRFGGVGASFTVVSNTRIDTTVPAAAVSGVITVITPSGSVNSPTSFTVSATPPPQTGFVPGVVPPSTRVRMGS